MKGCRRLESLVRWTVFAAASALVACSSGGGGGGGANGAGASDAGATAGVGAGDAAGSQGADGSAGSASPDASASADAAGGDVMETGPDTAGLPDTGEIGDAADVQGGADGESGDASGSSDDANQADGADGGLDGSTGGNGDGATSGEDTAQPLDTGADAGPGEPDTAVTPPEENASAELHIQITAPTPGDWAQSAGGKVGLGGLLFGHADAITWENATTGETGEIEPKSFWNSGPVSLDPGDNTLIVTATNQNGEEATDTVHIVYNMGVSFDAIPRVRPDMVFAGQKTEVVVTATMTNSNVDPSSVKLFVGAEIPADPSAVASVPMKDNGNLSNCDEIEGDGVFSACYTINEPDPVDLEFRVMATAKVLLDTITVWSAPFGVEVVMPVTQSQCESIVSTLGAARQAHDDALDGGASDADAIDAAIAALQADASVAQVGKAAGDGYGVWVRFDSGLLGVLNFSPDGLRGGSGGSGGDAAFETSSLAFGGPKPVNVGSRKATVLAPFHGEFDANDEAPVVRDMLKEVGCPPFDIDYAQGPKADVRAFRKMLTSGVMVVSTHGEALFGDLDPAIKDAYGWENEGSQEVLWTGEPIDCSTFTATTGSCGTDEADCGAAGVCVVGKTNRCIDYRHTDLRHGRMAFSDKTFAVLPTIVARYARYHRIPHGLAWLGACRSIYNGGWAGELMAWGARAVAGFSDYVSSEYAFSAGVPFFSALVDDKRMSGEALGDIPPPPSGESDVILVGGYNVTLNDQSLINASFETGDRTGWIKSGDGRVIKTLGATGPVHGKFMGLISTGLGFTQTTGELKQTFCLEPTQTQMCFYWKYYSEEFIEWCGSQFQDAFKATLSSKSVGTLDMVDVSVDDLCPVDQCTGCGGKYVGLAPSDVSFDQGGVYNTDWQHTCVDISQLAGIGPVTLKFFATDKGDSIYDTVILLDNVTVE